MAITEQVKKILNGEKVEESQGIEKAGLPVGTISGNYKKIADNPSKWEYLTQEQVFKNESGNERRAFLANKAPLITDIQELPCNEKNYKSVGTAFLYKMRNEVFTRDVICKANNKKVVDVNTSHIFKDKNTDENKTLRVRALPFVLPIIEKYGKRGLVTKRPDGIFTEVVGKADITVKGKKRRCAIAAVLVTNKKDRQALTQLSVFIVDNKVIKSLATDAPCVNRFVRSGLKNPCASNPHFSVHNSNITPLNNTVNRSVNISISDITEGNRKAKYEQLEKCLSGGIPEYIPADNTPRLGTINIKLKDYSSKRIEKALRTMAMSLSVPLKAAKGEVFFYKAQEDLTDKWCMFFSELVRNTYDYVTECLDLPKKTVMSKSDVFTHKGRILYNPSTGEPIKQSDWNKFVGNLEKFLNRNIKDVEKKIILESKSLSKILDRMLKYNTLEAVKKLRLEGLQYHGKSFDWISKNVKNMQNVFGESLTRQEQARIEVMTQSAAQEITNITDKMRGDIKQILIDGVKGKRSKGQVSQALFDKMVGDNRDFQRVADTEIQNAFNNSFVQEEVYNTEEGKKTYFKRIEVIDGNTCPKCKAINGKIAVWSDKPLNDEKSKDKNADYVIWEGKDGFEWECPISVKHPYCRGTWQRYDIGLDNINIDALVAEQSKNAKKWNNAVKAAKEEYKEKGIENPDDSTKGFTDRIQEIFNSEDVQKSLFTDWKVELHHLCEEKGLDYDSIIQKYDDKLTRFVAEEQLGQDAENVIAYKAYKDLNKSLTWSGHKLQERTTFNGLNISIENKKGTIRRGVDSDGHKWTVKMYFDYGYIRGTEGVDGDHVDCYLGGNENAKNVYIIHQKIPGTDKYDEDKCMLGFDTLADAKAAYLRQYDKPGFFGGVDTVPFDVFKNNVLLKKWHGKRLNLHQ